MRNIIGRELNTFFSSLIAYIIIGVFLLFLGLFMWVFQETSVLNYNYATLDQLFTIAPLVFIFLIPAISMRSFAEEHQNGTLELLLTKPISSLQLVLGKYFSVLILVTFALVPTIIYYYSVHKLGSPEGNIDSGAVLGSYIGLLLLSAVFSAIGIFSSSVILSRPTTYVHVSILGCTVTKKKRVRSFIVRTMKDLTLEFPIFGFPKQKILHF